MSLKIATLMALTVFCFNSSPSFAMYSSPKPLETLSLLDQSNASHFCKAPLQTICTDTEAKRKDLANYITMLKTEIAQEAKLNALPRIAEMKHKIPGIRFIKRAMEKIKINNQEIMKAASKRIVGFESAVINDENVSIIKEYLYQAIDSTQFSLARKNSSKSVIKSIVVGNFHDFIERTNLDDNGAAQLANHPCGADGMVENAFAAEIGNVRYVLLCPGFLINVNQTQSKSERFNSVLQAVSHEMSHHIDASSAGIQRYIPYLSCLAENNITQFKINQEDFNFCRNNKADPAKCAMKVIVSHSDELIADAWGIKVLNLHMRAQSYSFAQADQLLTESWEKLCGSDDEGTHPTGDFRIGTLLRSNPDISQYLSCDNSQITKPACTFEGQVGL